MTNRGEVSKKFQEFQDKNIQFKNSLVNALSYLKEVERQKSLSEDAIHSLDNAGGVSSSNFLTNFLKDKSELAATYKTLRLNISYIIDELEDLVSDVEKENESLKKYFNDLTFEDINSLRQFEELALRFNETKRTKFQQIVSRVPNLDLVSNKVFTVSSSISSDLKGLFGESVKNFSIVYVEFLNLLLSEDASSNKENLFNAFTSIVLYLQKYRRETNSLVQDFARGFVDAIETSNFPQTNKFENLGRKPHVLKSAKFFCSNFMKTNFSLGDDISVKLQTHLNSLGYENGRFTKSYAEANSDEKLDAFFKSSLKSLFRGVDFNKVSENSKIKNIDSLVKELFGESKEMRELTKTVNDLLHQLALKINSKFTYNKKKSFEDLEFAGYKISVFRNKIKNLNESELGNYINYLTSLLDNEDTEEFNNFVDKNKKKFDKNSSSSVTLKTISQQELKDIQDLLQQFSNLGDIDEMIRGWRDQNLFSDAVNDARTLLSLLFSGSDKTARENRFRSVCESFRRSGNAFENPIQKAISEYEENINSNLVNSDDEIVLRMIIRYTNNYLKFLTT